MRLGAILGLAAAALTFVLLWTARGFPLQLALLSAIATGGLVFVTVQTTFRLTALLRGLREPPFRRLADEDDGPDDRRQQEEMDRAAERPPDIQ